MNRRNVPLFLYTVAIAHLSAFHPIFLTQFADLGLDDVAGIPVLCLVKVVERFRSRATYSASLPGEVQ